MVAQLLELHTLVCSATCVAFLLAVSLTKKKTHAYDLMHIWIICLLLWLCTKIWQDCVLTAICDDSISVSVHWSGAQLPEMKIFTVHSVVDDVIRFTKLHGLPLPTNKHLARLIIHEQLHMTVFGLNFLDSYNIATVSDASLLDLEAWYKRNLVELVELVTQKCASIDVGDWHAGTLDDWAKQEALEITWDKFYETMYVSPNGDKIPAEDRADMPTIFTEYVRRTQILCDIRVRYTLGRAPSKVELGIMMNTRMNLRDSAIAWYKAKYNL